MFSFRLSCLATAALAALLCQFPAAIAEPPASSTQSAAAAKTKPARSLTIFNDWKSTELVKHKLVGRVWSSAEKRLVPPLVLEASLATADLALIGEVHDNPDHHRIQAFAIRTMGFKRKPAVVMEMLTVGQTKHLEAFYREMAATPRAAQVDLFFAKVHWKKSGWPSSKIYRPVVAAAINRGMRIHPGSDRPNSVRAIGRVGIEDLSVGRIRRLGLDAPLSEELEADLKKDLKTNHCGLIPDDALPAMAMVQRYRDGFMAASLHRASKPNGAILIAGNGHVRADRGVPWYLERIAPDKKVIVVMAVEVVKDNIDPATYLPKSSDGELTADYLIFTPRTRRTDPCEDMRKRLEANP